MSKARHFNTSLEPFWLPVLFFPLVPGILHAASIPIPNNSFESPLTDFVNINVDSWQKGPKPDWYIEGGGYTWNQLIGTFRNTTNTSPDHIDNCDGLQAIWMFAVPEVKLFQDYDSVGWNDPIPTHAFNAVYELGKSYHLTAGVIGGGFGMLEGVSLQLSLYYRDSMSNQVTVGSSDVIYHLEVFSNATHLVDFRLDVPAVKLSDPWAGQNIGVQILSTVTTNLEGGYWDLDNVRLVSILEPVLTNPSLTNGQFNFTVQSEAGLILEIQATTNLGNAAWDCLGTITNSTGTISFVDPSTNVNQRYYQVRRTL